MTHHSSMKYLADALRLAMEERGLSETELARETNLRALSIYSALSGREDCNVSTLLLLAERLGMELVLVPRNAAISIKPEGAGGAGTEKNTAG